MSDGYWVRRSRRAEDGDTSGAPVHVFLGVLRRRYLLGYGNARCAFRTVDLRGGGPRGERRAGRAEHVADFERAGKPDRRWYFRRADLFVLWIGGICGRGRDSGRLDALLCISGRLQSRRPTKIETLIMGSSDHEATPAPGPASLITVVKRNCSDLPLV